MSYKRAIAIGLLASLGIGLLVFGIKTGTFKKQNIGKITTPISYNLNKKRNTPPLRVDADDILPISTKWLINKSIPNTTTTNAGTTTTINFTSYFYYGYEAYAHTKINYSAFNVTKDSGKFYSIKYMPQNSSTYSNAWLSSSWENNNHWYSNSARIVEFSTEPTGTLYTWLNNYAQPAYNNDILMLQKNSNGTTYNTGIQQVRKSNIIIETSAMQNGAFINESASIDIYLDAGLTNLYINGNRITNLDQQLNITNNDIIIAGTGTTTGQYWKTFRINYFNTRPAIEPQPYPDASGKVTEVLDITGLMFQILTMPFTFISQAFNLTLWEGTPYQFNFSNFILSLIAIATIIFIIKLFTSGFSVVGNYTRHSADTKLKNSQTKLNKTKIKEIESKTPKKE